MSHARFSVCYRIAGQQAEVEQAAEEICFEQTIETPPDLAPRLLPSERVTELAGQLERIERIAEAAYEAEISYPVEATAFEIPQLLTVIFGNSSLKSGLRVERLIFSSELLSRFRGPRFGSAGIRTRVKVSQRPLLFGVLKPLGLSPTQLAELAYQMAAAGMDLIKDDHGLTNQTYALFEERVMLCAEAVTRANANFGGRCSYIACITAPAGEIIDRAYMAKHYGASGFLVAPGVTGFDVVRQLAEDDGLALPIYLHPTFLGMWHTNPVTGLAPVVIYAQLARLVGADATIFPNYGGRYAITRQECALISEYAINGLGSLKPMLRVPGGSVTAERMADMRAVYGDDVAYLLGRGLYQPTPDLAENLRLVRKMLERSVFA